MRGKKRVMKKTEVLKTEVRKSRSPEVQKSRSPEVRKSRSPVITIGGNAKGISVVAGLVPATIHLDNISVYRSKEVK